MTTNRGDVKAGQTIRIYAVGNAYAKVEDGPAFDVERVVRHRDGSVTAILGGLGRFPLPRTVVVVD